MKLGYAMVVVIPDGKTHNAVCSSVDHAVLVSRCAIRLIQLIAFDRYCRLLLRLGWLGEGGESCEGEDAGEEGVDG